MLWSGFFYDAFYCRELADIVFALRTQMLANVVLALRTQMLANVVLALRTQMLANVVLRSRGFVIPEFRFADFKSAIRRRRITNPPELTRGECGRDKAMA